VTALQQLAHCLAGLAAHSIRAVTSSAHARGSSTANISEDKGEAGNDWANTTFGKRRKAISKRIQRPNENVSLIIIKRYHGRINLSKYLISVAPDFRVAITFVVHQNRQDTYFSKSGEYSSKADSVVLSGLGLGTKCSGISATSQGDPRGSCQRSHALKI
jgi:hypothetical protein